MERPASWTRPQAQAILRTDQYSRFPKIPREYEGDYTSDELGVTFRLDLREGKLCFVHRNAPPGALQPTLEDRFVLGIWNLTFKRDAAGKVASFLLDTSRVRNLEFAKKEKIANP